MVISGYRFNLFEPRFLLITLVGAHLCSVCLFCGFSLTPAGHAAVLLPGSMPDDDSRLQRTDPYRTIRRSQWLAIGLILAGLALLENTALERRLCGRGPHLLAWSPIL